VTLNELLTQYVIPIISMVVSVAFGVYGYTSSLRANATLERIGKAVEAWQQQLVNATIDLVNSSPSITNSHIYQAKIEAFQSLSEAIKGASHQIVNNPKPGDEGIPLHAHLQTLLAQQERLAKELLTYQPPAT
jgi:hypothetical protein